MSTYSEMATAHLEAAAELANNIDLADNPGQMAAKYDRHIEIAREYVRLAAIEAGVPFPADPGETGEPS